MLKAERVGVPAGMEALCACWPGMAKTAPPFAVLMPIITYYR